MGFNPNGVLSRVPAEQRLNVFALVIYIPDPLGRFLDDLRTELVPGCNPHAHVSVLPPRPLAVDWQVAERAGEGVRRQLDAVRHRAGADSHLPGDQRHLPRTG